MKIKWPTSIEQEEWFRDRLVVLLVVVVLLAIGYGAGVKTARFWKVPPITCVEQTEEQAPSHSGVVMQFRVKQLDYEWRQAVAQERIATALETLAEQGRWKTGAACSECNRGKD